MKEILIQTITLSIGVVVSLITIMVAINIWNIAIPVAALLALPIMLSALFIAAYLTDKSSPLDGAWENDEYSAYKE